MYHTIGNSDFKYLLIFTHAHKALFKKKKLFCDVKSFSESQFKIKVRLGRTLI